MARNGMDDSVKFNVDKYVDRREQTVILDRDNIDSRGTRLRRLEYPISHDLHRVWPGQNIDNQDNEPVAQTQTEDFHKDHKEDYKQVLANSPDNAEERMADIHEVRRDEGREFEEGQQTLEPDTFGMDFSLTSTGHSKDHVHDPEGNKKHYVSSIFYSFNAPAVSDGANSPICEDRSHVPNLEGNDKEKDSCRSQILHTFERSFSIDQDGRKSHVSNRLLERRKTVELGKGDLPEIGVRQTSVLNVTVGSQPRFSEPSVMSEMNVIWGKIVDTSDVSCWAHNNSSFRSELQLSPLLNRSLDESTDYWSADVSTDTILTSDAYDTFVETCDSLYASDFNDSLVEQLEVQSGGSDADSVTRGTTTSPNRFSEVGDVAVQPWTPGSDLDAKRPGMLFTNIVELRNLHDLEPAENFSHGFAKVEEAKSHEAVLQLDKKVLYKVSDNIANLSFRIGEQCRQSHPLILPTDSQSAAFPKDSVCIRDPDSSLSGDLNENIGSRFQNNEDSIKTRCGCGVDGSPAHSSQKTKLRDSGYIGRLSQEDILDLKYGPNTDFRMDDMISVFPWEIRQGHGMSLNIASDYEADNESNDGLACCLEAEVVEENDLRKPIQGDLRLISLEDRAMLGISGMHDLCSDQIEDAADSDLMGIPSSECIDTDVNKDDRKPMQIVECVSPTESEKGNGLQYGYNSSHGNNTVDLPTDDAKYVNKGFVDTNEEIGATDNTIEQPLMLVYPEFDTARASRNEGDTDLQSSQNAGADNRGQLNMSHATGRSIRTESNSSIDEEKVKLQAAGDVEPTMFIECSPQSLPQISQHSPAQHIAGYPLPVSVSTSNICSADNHMSSKPSSEISPPAVVDPPRAAFEEVGSGTEDNDGFILVTSRRKKKDRKKKNHKLVDDIDEVINSDCDGSRGQDPQNIDLRKPDTSHCKLYQISSSDSVLIHSDAVNDEHIIPSGPVHVLESKKGNADLSLVNVCRFTDLVENGEDETRIAASKTTSGKEECPTDMQLVSGERPDLGVQHVTGHSVAGRLEDLQGFTGVPVRGSELRELLLAGQRDCANDNVLERQLSNPTEKGDSAEEFLSRILEGTNSHSAEHTKQFLHSDESGGVLLNLYTGGHRRILKPHRRFSKPQREINSKSVECEMKSCLKQRPVVSVEGASRKSMNVERPVDNDVATGLDGGTGVFDNDKDNGKINGNVHKRKRELASKHVTTTPDGGVGADADGSELDLSGEFGIADVTFEDLEDVGKVFDMFLISAADKTNSDKSDDTSDEKDTNLADEQNNFHFEDQSQDGETENGSTEALHPVNKRKMSYVGTNFDIPSGIPTYIESSRDVQLDIVWGSDYIQYNTVTGNMTEGERDGESSETVQCKSGQETDIPHIDLGTSSVDNNVVTVKVPESRDQTGALTCNSDFSFTNILDVAGQVSEFGNVSVGKRGIRSEISDIDGGKGEMQSEVSDVDGGKRETQSKISDINVDQLKPEISDITDVNVDQLKPEISDISDINVDKLKPEISVISDINVDKLKPEISDINVNRVQPEISGINADQVQTEISGINADQVQTEISDINVNQVQPEISDMNVNQVQPEISDINGDQVQTEISDINVNQVQTEISDINVNQVQTEISDINVNQVQTEISDVDSQKKVLQYRFPVHDMVNDDDSCNALCNDHVGDRTDATADFDDQSIKDFIREQVICLDRCESFLNAGTSDKLVFGKTAVKTRGKLPGRVAWSSFKCDEFLLEKCSDLEEKLSVDRVDKEEDTNLNDKVDTFSKMADLDESGKIYEKKTPEAMKEGESVYKIVDKSIQGKDANKDVINDNDGQCASINVNEHLNDPEDKTKDGFKKIKNSRESEERFIDKHVVQADSESGSDVASSSENCASLSQVSYVDGVIPGNKKESVFMENDMGSVYGGDKDHEAVGGYVDKRNNCNSVQRNGNSVFSLYLKDVIQSGDTNNLWKVEDNERKDFKVEEEMRGIGGDELYKIANEETCKYAAENDESWVRKCNHSENNEELRGFGREETMIDNGDWKVEGINDVGLRSVGENEDKRGSEKDECREERGDFAVTKTDDSNAENFGWKFEEIDCVRMDDGGEGRNIDKIDKPETHEDENTVGDGEYFRSNDFKWGVEDIGDVRWDSDDDREDGQSGDEDKCPATKDETDAADKRSSFKTSDIMWKVDESSDVRCDNEEDKNISGGLDEDKEIKDESAVGDRSNFKSEDCEWKLDDIGDVRWESDDEDEKRSCGLDKGMDKEPESAAVVEWVIEGNCDMKWKSYDEEERTNDKVNKSIEVKDENAVDSRCDLKSDDFDWKVEDIGDVKWESDDEIKETIDDKEDNNNVADDNETGKIDGSKVEEIKWSVEDIVDVKWESDDDEGGNDGVDKLIEKKVESTVDSRDVKSEYCGWKVEDIGDVRWESDDDGKETVDDQSDSKDVDDDKEAEQIDASKIDDTEWNIEVIGDVKWESDDVGRETIDDNDNIKVAEDNKVEKRDGSKIEEIKWNVEDIGGVKWESDNDEGGDDGADMDIAIKVESTVDSRDNLKSEYCGWKVEDMGDVRWESDDDEGGDDGADMDIAIKVESTVDSRDNLKSEYCGWKVEDMGDVRWESDDEIKETIDDKEDNNNVADDNETVKIDGSKVEEIKWSVEDIGDVKWESDDDWKETIDDKEDNKDVKHDNETEKRDGFKIDDPKFSVEDIDDVNWESDDEGKETIDDLADGTDIEDEKIDGSKIEDEKWNVEDIGDVKWESDDEERKHDSVDKGNIIKDDDAVGSRCDFKSDDFDWKVEDIGDVKWESDDEGKETIDDPADGTDIEDDNETEKIDGSKIEDEKFSVEDIDDVKWESDDEGKVTIDDPADATDIEDDNETEKIDGSKIEDEKWSVEDIGDVKWESDDDEERKYDSVDKGNKIKEDNAVGTRCDFKSDDFDWKVEDIGDVKWESDNDESGDDGVDKDIDIKSESTVNSRGNLKSENCYWKVEDIGDVRWESDDDGKETIDDEEDNNDVADDNETGKRIVSKIEEIKWSVEDIGDAKWESDDPEKVTTGAGVDECLDCQDESVDKKTDEAKADNCKWKVENIGDVKWESDDEDRETIDDPADVEDDKVAEKRDGSETDEIKWSVEDIGDVKWESDNEEERKNYSVDKGNEIKDENAVDSRGDFNSDDFDWKVEDIDDVKWESDDESKETIDDKKDNKKVADDNETDKSDGSKVEEIKWSVEDIGDVKWESDDEGKETIDDPAEGKDVKHDNETEKRDDFKIDDPKFSVERFDDVKWVSDDEGKETIDDLADGTDIEDDNETEKIDGSKIEDEKWSVEDIDDVKWESDNDESGDDEVDKDIDIKSESTVNSRGNLKSENCYWKVEDIGDVRWESDDDGKETIDDKEDNNDVADDNETGKRIGSKIEEIKWSVEDIGDVKWESDDPEKVTTGAGVDECLDCQDESVDKKTDEAKADNLKWKVENIGDVKWESDDEDRETIDDPADVEDDKVAEKRDGSETDEIKWSVEDIGDVKWESDNEEERKNYSVDKGNEIKDENAVDSRGDFNSDDFDWKVEDIDDVKWESDDESKETIDDKKDNKKVADDNETDKSDGSKVEEIKWSVEDIDDVKWESDDEGKVTIDDLADATDIEDDNETEKIDGSKIKDEKWSVEDIDDVKWVSDDEGKVTIDDLADGTDIEDDNETEKIDVCKIEDEKWSVEDIDDVKWVSDENEERKSDSVDEGNEIKDENDVGNRVDFKSVDVEIESDDGRDEKKDRIYSRDDESAEVIDENIVDKIDDIKADDVKLKVEDISDVKWESDFEDEERIGHVVDNKVDIDERAVEDIDNVRWEERDDGDEEGRDNFENNCMQGRDESADTNKDNFKTDNANVKVEDIGDVKWENADRNEEKHSFQNQCVVGRDERTDINEDFKTDVIWKVEDIGDVKWESDYEHMKSVNKEMKDEGTVGNHDCFKTDNMKPNMNGCGNVKWLSNSEGEEATNNEENVNTITEEFQTHFGCDVKDNSDVKLKSRNQDEERKDIQGMNMQENKADSGLNKRDFKKENLGNKFENTQENNVVHETTLPKNEKLEERLTEAVEQEVDILEEGLTEAVEQEVDRLEEGLTEAVEQEVDRLEEGLTEAVEQEVDRLEEGLTEAVEQEVDRLEEGLTEAVEHEVDRLEEGLTEAVEQEVDRLEEGLTEAVEQEVDRLEEELTEAVEQEVDRLEEGLTEAVEQEVDRLEEGLTEAVEQEVDRLESGLTEAVQQEVDRLGEGLTEAVEQEIDRLEERLTGAVEQEVDRLEEGLTEAVEQEVDRLEEGLTEAVEQEVERLESFVLPGAKYTIKFSGLAVKIEDGGEKYYVPGETGINKPKASGHATSRSCKLSDSCNDSFAKAIRLGDMSSSKVTSLSPEVIHSPDLRYDDLAAETNDTTASAENVESTVQDKWDKFSPESETVELTPVQSPKIQLEIKKKNKRRKNKKKNIKALALERAVKVKEPLSEALKRAVGDSKGVATLDEKQSAQLGRGGSHSDESVREMADGCIGKCEGRPTSTDLVEVKWNVGDTVKDTDMSSQLEHTQYVEHPSRRDGGEIKEVDIGESKEIDKVELSLSREDNIEDNGGHCSSTENIERRENQSVHQLTSDNTDIYFNIECVAKRVDLALGVDKDSVADAEKLSLPVDAGSTYRHGKHNTNSINADCSVDNVDVDVGYQTEDFPTVFVDRHEQWILHSHKPTINKRLLEDVIHNKGRAEQLVAQNPEASQRQIIRDTKSASEEPTLTPAGHLMSEMALLETSARDQWETLELAVSQQGRYEAEVQYLNIAIGAAQQKLQASPETATSVGALKQQIAERNNLTEQIKFYQMKVYEINEKSRQLALDSAQLSPSVFRKHYHPESAYSDYFAATAQNKRGASPLPMTGNLFYDSLPEFDFSWSSDQEPSSPSTGEPKRKREPWKPLDHPSIRFNPISLELPRKIPPPRTDSIPRPTWSGDILSMSGSGSDPSRGTSTSRSLDSPRTSSKAYETSASSPKSMDSTDASTKQFVEPFISIATAEAGPQISRTRDAPSMSTTSWDSGLGNDASEQSSTSFPFQTDNSTSVGSIAEKLKSVADQSSKRAPTGGRPTEILRMLGAHDQDRARRSASVSSLMEDDSDNPNQDIMTSPHFRRTSQVWTDYSEANNPSSESLHFGSMLATSTPLAGKSNLDPSTREISSLFEVRTDDLVRSGNSGTGDILHEQDAIQENQKHIDDLEACKKQIGDLQGWLEEKKAGQSSLTLSLENPVELQVQLDANQNIQEEINSQLRQLSDLVLQCDNEYLNENPVLLEKLQSDLGNIQRDLEQFNLDTIEKQVQLEAAITETQENGAYSSVQGLEKWELAKDIREHRQLVGQIADQGRHSTSSSADLKSSDMEVRGNWEKLSRDLKQRKENLETILRTKKPGEMVTISMHAPARHDDSTKQLEEVKSAVLDLNNFWNKQQEQLYGKELHPDENRTFQQQCQSVVQNVSNWMDLAEQQLFIVPLTIEEQIGQNEDLQRQIRSVKGAVATMNERAEDLLASTDSANKDLIEQCLGSISERINLVENTAQSQTVDLHQTESKWRQYQDGVAKLQKQLQDTQKYIMVPASAQSLEQNLSDGQKIEAHLKQCETDLGELKRKEASLTLGYPKGIFTSGLATLQSKYTELNRKALENKSSIQNFAVVQNQYQKMLKDCADFLNTAQDKLQTDSVSARDLNQLKQQLASHKDFFSDLEVHKAMLDSLASNCDPSTKTQFHQQHSALSSLIHVLVDQASLHGQRLERLIHQWSELEEKHITAQKVLSSLKSQMPQPIASDDALSTIQDKLNKYKRLHSELADKRDTVFEVVEKGRQILHSINCSTLETAITDLADKWVSLNNTITTELKRSENLGDQLSEFEAEAAVLSSWLITARMKLASFKHLSTSSLRTIAAVRTEVEKVLEFRKEVEDQVPLKNKILAVGRQLMKNKNYDTKGLAGRLRDYEEEWAQLEKGIAETQEYLHQVQMELMPSRQTLNELIAWTEEISKSLEKDAGIMTRNIVDITIMVKKYKDHKIELVSKQMSLDFVNQQVLALRPGELDVPKEKRDFADKLEALNRQWKKVVAEVNGRLNTLEGKHIKWVEYEQSLEKLHAWFHEQEDKIKRYQLIGSEFGVKQTLKDCKVLQQQLQDKLAELTSFKTLGNYLYGLNQDSPKTQQSIKDSMSTLDQKWNRLEDQARQLQNLLMDMLGYWVKYNTDLTDLSHTLTEAQYALNHCTLIRGDIDTLRSHLAKLKNLHAGLKQKSGHLESFSALASQLRQVCEPSVQVDIQKTVSEIQTKWKQLNTDLASRCKEFERYLGGWQEFENYYSKIQSWLETKESLCTDLTNTGIVSLRRPEYLKKCKQLQQELDNFQTQISDLNRMSDNLLNNMTPSSMSIMTSRQSAIEQKLLALKQILSQFSASLSNDISMLEKFKEAFEAAKKFLTYAETILAHVEPTKAAEEKYIQSRLDELKELLMQFSNNFVKLDTVNDLGYRLALNEIDASQLRELNHKWYRLYEDTRDRSRTHQSNVLQQQDFASKCENWMTFLAQTEQNLAEMTPRNLSSLSDQLHKCEQFENEVYSRQQVLNAIISDSQKMMIAGEVENKDDFQRKLQLLSEQWQNVSRRVNQRKALLENINAQWQQFNTLSQQLSQWLKDKENTLLAFEFDSNSVQVNRNLMEKAQAIKNEFKLKEPAFKNIQDLGSILLQNADDTEANKIQNIQRDWYKTLRAVDANISHLKGIDHQWMDCESEIDDMMSKLKDIRGILNSDIPTTYDALQTDMSRCRDIANDFIKSEDKQHHLLDKEKHLGKVVKKEDMNLLHQRIQLLSKQREELHHKSHVREEKITDALFRWTNLDERMQALMDWVEDMTIKVVSNRDMHVEDLLAKLENEYRKELEDKDVQKTMIEDQGRQLMRVSSAMRAADIEQKLHRLEEKWQHLNGVIDFRRRKLKETVLAVKQLDTSMKNLSRWLSSVETELSGGIMFRDSGLREIQAKLQDSQELQQELERRSAGVSAVLNLCDVLLHDSDACPTETEFLTLQHARGNLEKRWQNICSILPQRRTRVEETWQLWETFRNDCERFSEWMTRAEQDVGDSEIEVPNIKAAKASIQKYEDLQRNIHDHLSDLENINRQYCQLAKEGCTDTDGSRKVILTELNNRWDALQLRVTEIMKKLRHSSSIREDFEATRTSLVTWLTEVDAQLTDMQHPTNLDLQAKVIDIRRIEDEVHTKHYRMKYLDQAGVYLMQKGDSQEALRVQRQLDEFKAFCRTVLGRVATTQLQIEHMVVAQAEELSGKYGSEDRHYQLAANRSSELQNVQRTYDVDKQTAELERYLKESPPESPPVVQRLDATSRRYVSPSRITSSPTRRSGSPVQRSKSPTYLRAASPTRMPETITRSVSPQRGPFLRQQSPSWSAGHVTDDQKQGRRDINSLERSTKINLRRRDINSLERSTKINLLMEQLVESLDDCNIKLARLEKDLGPFGNAEERTRSSVECEIAVGDVRRLDQLLKAETGLNNIDSVDAQVKFVLRRWEHLQRQVREFDVKFSHESHDLVQLGNDIESMLVWLDGAEDLQSAHRRLPSDVSELDTVIQEYKHFIDQMESKKPIVMSVNLLSEKYLRGKSARTRQLSGKLCEMNRRWELILSWAKEVQRDLQLPLVQCQQLLHTIDDYQLWVDSIETKIRHCEPINLSADESTLWEKYSKLMELHEDIMNNQPKVLALKETADWLLKSTESSEMSTARDKIYIVQKRLQSLIHLTSAYTTSLENRLQTRPTKGIATDFFDMSEGRSSGLGSSHPSRSITPLLPGSMSMRTRSRSPFAISRWLEYRT